MNRAFFVHGLLYRKNLINGMVSKVYLVRDQGLEPWTP